MGQVTVTATSDVPNEYVDDFVREIGHEKCSNSDSRITLCSVEPPSFIQVIGTLVNWQTVFGVSATVFLSTLAKRLAEDVYDRKKVVAGALFEPLKRFSKVIANFTRRSETRSGVYVEIIAPRGTPNPSISFRSQSEKEIVFELSCFYATSEQILQHLIRISKECEGGLTPPVVSVSGSGDVTVRCYHGQNNDLVEFTISVRNSSNAMESGA